MKPLKEIHRKAGLVLRNIYEELEDALVEMRFENSNVIYYIQIGDYRISRSLLFHTLDHIGHLTYLSDDVLYFVRKTFKKEGKAMRIHTIPLNDEHLHSAQMTCRCNPLLKEDGVVLHNAFDSREKFERQNIRDVSDGWVLIEENF